MRRWRSSRRVVSPKKWFFRKVRVCKGSLIGRLVPADGQSRWDCALQPRVARNELPWENRGEKWVQPQRGCGQRSVGRATTPSGLALPTPPTQGSSFLATLGFGPESLRDRTPSKKNRKNGTLPRISRIPRSSRLHPCPLSHLPLNRKSPPSPGRSSTARTAHEAPPWRRTAADWPAQ